MILFLSFVWGVLIFWLIIRRLLSLSKHETLDELAMSYNCIDNNFCRNSEILELMYLSELEEQPSFTSTWAYRGTSIYCVEEGIHIKMNLLLWSRHFFIPWVDILVTESTNGPDLVPLIKLQLRHCTKPIAVTNKLRNCKYWKLNIDKANTSNRGQAIF